MRETGGRGRGSKGDEWEMREEKGMGDERDEERSGWREGSKLWDTISNF